MKTIKLDLPENLGFIPKYYAVDRDGEGYVFSHLPVVRDDMWVETSLNHKSQLVQHLANPYPNWKDSLREIIHEDAPNLYFVVLEGAYKPDSTAATQEEAITCAEELAAGYPGNTYLVLKATHRVTQAARPIKVEEL